MKVYFWAILSIFSFFSFPVGAQVCGEDCTTPPTCSQLGYKKGLTCPEGGIICPFDASYKWCKEYTCDDGRYYSSPLAGDYTCAKVEYHGLTCYDCVAAVEEDICSAYDEQTLVEALQCADCPVITVLNDISITDKLPDLKEGQTLKAADGQTYTITVNPSDDIQTSDPEFEISQDGQTMKVKLSQVFGAAPGIILTTAAGSRIDNIHFEVAATHNVDAVIVPLGDTTFNNLSIVIDGKDEEIERFLTAGILPINPGGKIAFEGDTYIEMKNIKGRQAVAGVWDFMVEFGAGAPDTSVTADNIDIVQENISGENGASGGLVLGNLDASGNIEIMQNGNDNATGFYINNNATINGDIEITQSNSSSATGININRALKARNITITQKNCFGSENNTLSLAGIKNFTPNPNLSGSIEAESITITQDTFNSGETATYYTSHRAEGITIDKIKAKQITIYQDAKPQEPYHTAHHVYGIYTKTSEIENINVTQLPFITGGYGSYALYGGQYNNVTIVSEAFVWPDISAHEGKSALGGDISITGTADITLINGANLVRDNDSNIFINNAVINRQCSELYPSSKPDNITINNLTDNYTPCE